MDPDAADARFPLPAMMLIQTDMTSHSRDPEVPRYCKGSYLKLVAELGALGLTELEPDSVVLEEIISLLWNMTDVAQLWSTVSSWCCYCSKKRHIHGPRESEWEVI